MMKITIEGWKDEPVVLENVEQFIVSAGDSHGVNRTHIDGNIQYKCFFARLIDEEVSRSIKASYKVKED